jgi:hypothetical protein
VRERKMNDADRHCLDVHAEEEKNVRIKNFISFLSFV